jgi:hypothetical protein
MTRIAVISTCYNRRDQTVAWLPALQQQFTSDISVAVYLILTYWGRFAKRHGGPIWLLYAVWAYLRLISTTNIPAIPGTLARDGIAVRG